HEIGSLAKPPWLVKTNSGRALADEDIDHARRWGEKVGVQGYEELLELLRRPERDPIAVARWSSRYALRLLESAGVDVGYEGEPRLRARARPQRDPAESPGPDRPRRDVDPDRRARRLHRGGRARALRGELQRERRGSRLLLLDPPVLL